MNLPKAQYEEHTKPMQSHINVGYGSDITIAQLAQTIGRVIGYTGHIDFDSTKPDGTPRKLMNSTLLKTLGWNPRVDIEEGLSIAYQDYLKKCLSD